MERLTFDGDFCDISQCAETRGGSFCESGACSQRQVWERLKAYEDTGLTPERCAELAQADKDGQLVVLPCKVGDTVYFAAWFGTYPHIVKRVVEPYFYTDDARGHGSSADFSLRDFGKTVFLTREEAEKALEEAHNDEL